MKNHFYRTCNICKHNLLQSIYMHNIHIKYACYLYTYPQNCLYIACSIIMFRNGCTCSLFIFNPSAECFPICIHAVIHSLFKYCNINSVCILIIQWHLKETESWGVLDLKEILTCQKKKNFSYVLI